MGWGELPTPLKLLIFRLNDNSGAEYGLYSWLKVKDTREEIRAETIFTASSSAPVKTI